MKSHSCVIRACAVLLACGLFCTLQIACDRDKSADQQTPTIVIAQLAGNSGCKAEVDSFPGDAAGCLSFAYAENGDLTVTHVNALLNCCMTGTSITATLDGRSLTIKETETYVGSSPCRCLCRFDIDYVLKGITPGRYLVKLDDGYYSAGEPVIEGYVDFAASPIAPICETYPDYQARPLAHYPRRLPQPVE